MDLKIIRTEHIRSLLTHWPGIARTQRKLLADFDPKLLERAVKRAIRDIPFYKDYAQYISNGTFDITRFPIIRKPDIKGHTRELVSKRIPKYFRVMKRTAGSTGIPLDVYYSPRLFIEKDLIVQHLFGLFGKGQRIALLRDHTSTGEIIESVGAKHWLLSPYFLSTQNLDKYLDILQQLHINVLHVYPSAITILARLIKDKYGTCPVKGIRGIFASSESFDRDEKKIVKEVFPEAHLIDFYGHNELACNASAEDFGYFHFYMNFGYVEFLPTGDTLPNGNMICEIVATSVLNRTMPLIRYGTQDCVEMDKDGNIVSIYGRTSDFIVTKQGDVVPCLFLTRPSSTLNVINRQYYQPEPGKLITRVVVNDKYTEADRISMLEDMQRSFKDKMDCDVVIVPSIERGGRSKQKRLVQDVDIHLYR